MPILIGVQRDYNAICAQSPIGIEVDNPEGIDEEGRTRIQDLNDLGGLLEFRDLLQELNACDDLTAFALGRVLRGLQRAPGDTVVERFLHSLQQVCRDQQCSGLPAQHRSAAIERLNLLYEEGQAREIRISERRLAELVRLEGEQSQRGIERSLSAVNILISRLASRVDINEANLSLERVNEMLREHCQEGVAPVINPPPDPDQIEVVEPPPDGSEPTPPERRVEFGFLTEAGASYSYDALEESSELGLNMGPGILARAEGEIRYTPLRFRFGYEMTGTTNNSFSAPRSTADQFFIAAQGRVRENMELGGEVEVNWQGGASGEDNQSFEFARNLFVDIGALLSIAFAEGRGAANILAGLNILTSETDGGRIGGYFSAGGRYRGRGRLGVTWDGGYSHAAGAHRAGAFAGMPINIVTFGSADISLTFEVNAGVIYNSLPQHTVSVYGGATLSLGNISRLIRSWGVF
jgi:hypothetical protein